MQSDPNIVGPPPLPQPSSPDLMGRVSVVETELAAINRKLGRMPGSYGVDDEGEGAWKMLYEIRRAQRKSNTAVHALVTTAAVVATAVVNHLLPGTPTAVPVPIPMVAPGQAAAR